VREIDESLKMQKKNKTNVRMWKTATHEWQYLQGSKLATNTNIKEFKNFFTSTKHYFGIGYTVLVSIDLWDEYFW